MTKKLTNEELLRQYTNACFRITNYPNNLSEHKKFVRLKEELENRLGIKKGENK